MIQPLLITNRAQNTPPSVLRTETSPSKLEEDFVGVTTKMAGADGAN